MAILSNINGKFAVDSTGAIQFSGAAGTSGYVLKSTGSGTAPTWVDPSTVIGGPYLPLTGGVLTGATSTSSGISFTVGGTLTVDGVTTLNANVLMGNTVVNPVSGFADQTGIGLKYSTTVPELQVSSDSTALQLGRTSTGGDGQIMALRYASNTIHTFSTNAISIGTDATFAGDVGIGVTPTKALQVNGEALFGNGTDGLLLSYSGGNSSGIIDTGFSATALEFRVGNTQELLINGTSATFAGEVNVPSGKISVLGGNNLTISGTVADHCGLSFATNAILPCTVSVTNTNTVDLGASSEKFKDFYYAGAMTGGTELFQEL